ncbi:MAG: ATP-binding cassette domain-containing protein [Spirochaetaceae bacterium]
MNISISGLIKMYGKQKVLDLDKLTLNTGLTCILGPNGCGKTTLLDILSGHLDYQSGCITYNHKMYSKNIANKITLVTQKPYILNRSVYENIAYPLKVRGFQGSDIINKVNSIMSKLEITNLSDKKGTKLSSGESQKCALARALVFEPELLMLDESTSNIDYESKKVIEKTIIEYAQGGKTVVFVTHDLKQAKLLTDKIVYL